MNNRAGNSRTRNTRGNYPSINRVSRNFVTPAELNRRLRGFAPQGSFDPPRIVANPWNSLVIAAAVNNATAGTAQITCGSLATSLRGQIGLPQSVVLLMRFQRVSVWTTPVDVVSNALNFALLPADLVIARSNRQWLEDAGTPARPAHLHFVWSSSEQNIVFQSTNSSTVVVFSLDTDDAFGGVAHVHVLWRPDGGDPIPTRTISLLRPDDRPEEEHLGNAEQ